MFYQRMENTSADIRARLDVRLVVPLRRTKMAEAIDGALGLLGEGTSAWWSWNNRAAWLGLLPRLRLLA